MIFLIAMTVTVIGAYFYLNITSAPQEKRKLDPLSLTGEEEAIITALSGEVFILREDEIFEAETGTALLAGDIIKVVDESFCQIQFSTTASARLRSNSIVKIRQILNMSKTPDIKTEILTGTMLYKVNKLRNGEKLEVKSEDKIYSVKGTTFLVDRNSDGTLLIVDEGLVSVTKENNPTNPVETGAGQEYFAGNLSPITPSSKEMMAEKNDMKILDLAGEKGSLIRTELVTVPPDAQIYVNGYLSGQGSYKGIYPVGEEVIVLVRKRGYKDKVLTINSQSDMEYRIILDPESSDPEILEKERAISSESNALNKLKRELASRTTRLKEVEQLIVVLKGENSELNSRVALAENKLRRTSGQLQQLQQQKTDLAEQIKDLQRQLDESTARENKLRELIKQIQEISSDSPSGE